MIIKSSEVPYEIRTYVKSKLQKDLRKFAIDQKGKFSIHAPWHDGCSNFYKVFALKNDKFVELNDKDLYYSGLDYNYKGEQNDIEVPASCIVVKISTYPESCTIYTSSDATQFLPQHNNFELTEDEKKALYYSRALIAAFRPKFEDVVYESLISKKLMKKNRSITIGGLNYLETIKGHTVNYSTIC